MKTDDLIVTLAHDSAPWTPLAPARTRAARWLLGSAALCVATIAIVGARADLVLALRTPVYLALAITLLSSALLGAFAAMTLSVPGAESTPALRVLSVILAAGWALSFVVRLLPGGDAWPRIAAFPNHWACVAEITGLSLVSGGVLYAMMRRAAPLRLGWSAAVATLASATLAATATQIMCPIDDPAHHVVSHVAPVAVLVLAGAILGRRAIAKPRAY